MLDIAIVGAGPYGLSLAAHLQKLNVDFRIFGKPMQGWREHMPPGMFLKSDGESLDLPDPNSELTIKKFYSKKGKSLGGAQIVNVDNFIAYGMEFQSQMVPKLEPLDVLSIEADNDGFILRLSNQELVRTRQVVMAVGVYFFRYLPPVIANLPPEYCTHSAEYGDVEKFRGKKIGIVGAGASAIDLAVALAQHGAEPTIISRRTQLRFQSAPSAPEQPTFASRAMAYIKNIHKPNCGIGTGWMLKFYAEAPHILRLFPATLRRTILRKTLGPASTWVTKDLVTSLKVPVLLGHAPTDARVGSDGKVHLTLIKRDGSTCDFSADHIIGATGYQTDLEKLPFLGASVRQKIRTFDGAPVLSHRFETTCRGLYFVGPATAMSFGPVMRFVFGSGFTMKSIMKRLAPDGKRRATSELVAPITTIVKQAA